MFIFKREGKRKGEGGGGKEREEEGEKKKRKEGGRRGRKKKEEGKKNVVTPRLSGSIWTQTLALGMTSQVF